MERKAHEVLRGIVERDGRYRRDAYCFIFEALDFTVKNVVIRQGHVTGRELLEGIRLYALDQFGGLTPLVFNTWGVTRTEDFGEIVFNLVEASLMGRTENDSKEDFANGYAFANAFAVELCSSSPGAKRTR